MAAILMTGTVLFCASPALAQGLSDPNAVDSIIGSEVVQEETEAAANPQKVIAAIEKTSESIATVRRVFNLDKVDVVYLTDSGVLDGGPPPEIEAKVKEHKTEIDQLRSELEGNAMLYHAIDSLQILVRDVLAVEFDDSNGVIIYAAAKPASPQ
jgi:hypothetical protein